MGRLGDLKKNLTFWEKSIGIRAEISEEKPPLPQLVPRGSPFYFMYDMKLQQSVPTLVDNKEVTETTTEENNETDDSDNDLLLRIIFKKWQ